MIAEEGEEDLFVNVNGSRMSRQGFWKIVKAYQKKGQHKERNNAAHAAPFLRGAPS
jgi:integrase/recombinase XerD